MINNAGSSEHGFLREIIWYMIACDGSVCKPYRGIMKLTAGDGKRYAMDCLNEEVVDE